MVAKKYPPTGGLFFTDGCYLIELPKFSAKMIAFEMSASVGLPGNSKGFLQIPFQIFRLRAHIAHRPAAPAKAAVISGIFIENAFVFRKLQDISHCRKY